MGLLKGMYSGVRKGASALADGVSSTYRAVSDVVKPSRGLRSREGGLGTKLLSAGLAVGGVGAAADYAVAEDFRIPNGTYRVSVVNNAVQRASRGDRIIFEDGEHNWVPEQGTRAVLDKAGIYVGGEDQDSRISTRIGWGQGGENKIMFDIQAADICVANFTATNGFNVVDATDSRAENVMVLGVRTDRNKINTFGIMGNHYTNSSRRDDADLNIAFGHFEGGDLIAAFDEFGEPITDMSTYLGVYDNYSRGVKRQIHDTPIYTTNGSFDCENGVVVVKGSDDHERNIHDENQAAIFRNYFCYIEGSPHDNAESETNELSFEDMGWRGNIERANLGVSAHGVVLPSSSIITDMTVLPGDKRCFGDFHWASFENTLGDVWWTRDFKTEILPDMREVYKGDGRVGLGDYARFNELMRGPGVMYNSATEGDMDLGSADADADGDVDLRDAAVFMNAFTGE